jgi:hypothetical protein
MVEGGSAGVHRLSEVLGQVGRAIEIDLMCADGTGLTRLTNNAASEYTPNWSPPWQPDPSTRIANVA